MLYPKLKLITKKVLDDRQAVLTLMRWREKNKFAYPNDPPRLTEEGFRRYLEKQLFSQFRFLFWVIAEDGPIGHIGLYRFKNDSCEIDNVARGVNRHKGYMSLAFKKLIKWTLKNLPVNSLYLRVLRTNAHAISFYEKNNFKPVWKNKTWVKMKYETIHS